MRRRTRRSFNGRGVMLLVILISFSALLAIFSRVEGERTPQARFITEGFIEKWLRNENGTLVTYIRTDQQVDEDLVQGREALAETLGLWMEYALLKDDTDMFADAYTLLNRHFLEYDGFVYWKLTAKGHSDVTSNALIDDLRIIHALFQASDRWHNETFAETARKISDYLAEYNQTNHALTDFYEREDGYNSDVLTLSYIDPQALHAMVEHDVLGESTQTTMLSILRHAPLENDFYPKSYNVKTKRYHYNDDVNMIDQALTGLQTARAGHKAEPLLAFVKQEMDRRGLVYGKYNRSTRMPAVEYESPATYAFLVMFCLEINEHELAERIYERMMAFRQNDPQHDYYGGFSVDERGDTHIFDNLMPLLAERKMEDGDRRSCADRWN
ncbi:glycosyl hydrolase family 8 [Thalassobacillus sp. CUG 92003]|uniref:glycosyl hydrolase family 8 n=1 Tax=Thalassobacillus sp. CUG 92003 TaxID=2736641 RepID=UPI0015E71DE9|nr:glycosyl hydrolase family 8 [Thalassobacillus sp. CUG 92003]